MNGIVAVIICLVIVTVIIVFLAVRASNFSRWTCTENGCESMIGGAYKTLGECQNSCNPKPVIPKYSCVSPGSCAYDINGTYNTMDDCMANCK